MELLAHASTTWWQNAFRANHDKDMQDECSRLQCNRLR